MPGMSDAAASRQVESWFWAHPAHGERSTAAPADSFTVQNVNFDENHDLAVTQVDTARITQGQTVLFKWVNGVHTITSGTGSTDPNVGALFDVPSDFSHTTFSFQFNSVGTVRFFCRVHESFNMRGVVIVSAAASVQPLAGGAGGIGFTASPWPNPTRGTTTFRFSLQVAGAFGSRSRGRILCGSLGRAAARRIPRSSWHLSAIPRAAGCGAESPGRGPEIGPA
jgi:plastocyanin